MGISYFSCDDDKDFEKYTFDFYKIPSSVSNDIELIKKLKDKKKSEEYEEWFLRYRPLELKKKDENENNSSQKKLNKTKSISPLNK